MNQSRGTRTRRRALAIAIMLAAMMAAGCKSSEISVEGGTQLFGPRRVKVGETFEVRQPFDAKTGAAWELWKYDSRIVQLTTFEPVDMSDPNAMVRIMRFIAQSPGETEIVMLRRNRESLAPGMTPPPREQKAIAIRVVE